MKNIVLKIQEGELFRFCNGEDRQQLIIGSKRTADIVIKSPYVQPEQVRILCKNGVWYAEDLSEPDCKCSVLLGKKAFKKPVLRLDAPLTLYRAGEKKNAPIAEISVVKQIRPQKGGSGFDLTKKTVTTVGSGEKCDIRSQNPLVSERHFFIVYDGENCFIEDAHSLRGTYVNNRKIKRSKLNDYDRISIPGAAYIFFRNKLLYSTAAGGIRIDAADICKEVQDRNSRGKISLVTHVSFRIGAGNFVAVVGGSGAGKSTMLDCINGMRPATGGKIYYDTNDYYENMNSYKGVIGYVPQKDIMHDDLTVGAALRYTAQLRTRADISPQELKERVQSAIADVRLQGKENLRISALSGGQKKRVSIAMELLSDPKVIFLDEPTSGLSPDLDLEMMELLKDLSRKGRTIVVITHAMENLDKCDRVAFLGRGGRLCYYGESAGAFRWFNRRSYSKIFAALSDEEISEQFAKKYRRSDDYKKLYADFCEEYGPGCILPPEQAEPDTAAWEKPPRPLTKKRLRLHSVSSETAPESQRNESDENGPDSKEENAASGKSRRSAATPVLKEKTQ